MREFVEESFRHWIPRHNSNGIAPRGKPISYLTETQLLHRARKFCSTLRRANEGYIEPLTRVVRITYGRTGPRRYQLLSKFTGGTLPSDGKTEGSKGDRQVKTSQKVASKNGENLSKDSVSQQPIGQSLSATGTSTASSTKDPDHIEEYSKEWKPPAHFLALVTSQAAQQHTFARVGNHPRVKVKFNPPATNIWGRPLPRKRYKNLKRKWYEALVAAALPPLPEGEYTELHAIVSGTNEFPAPVPRRTPVGAMSEEKADHEDSLAVQSSLVLEGPKPGPRLKDVANGRPHNLTPRLLRRLLSRVVLQQTPLVRVVDPSTAGATNARVVFHWDDGLTTDKVTQDKLVSTTTPGQLDLLFG